MAKSRLWYWPRSQERAVPKITCDVSDRKPAPTKNMGFFVESARTQPEATDRHRQSPLRVHSNSPKNRRFAAAGGSVHRPPFSSGSVVGGRVSDGAGSSVAAEWPDRARAVALRPLPGWCGCVYKPGWLWHCFPLRMAKRVSKRATRGGERQSTEAPGHRIRAPRPERSARLVPIRRACFPGACGPGGSPAR